MRVRVLYHDHCFDGAAAAAYFTRFTREKFYPAATYFYTGMMHEPNQTFDQGLFDGDENAIVDFKYAPVDKLTWWFDHHQSAFLSPVDAEHFQGRKAEHHFFDPNYKSCTKFIATVAREKYGFTAPDLDDLVRWADIIDGAQYANAKEAVEIATPATQLVLVIEGAKGSDAVQRIIGMMQNQPLPEIAADPGIRAVFEPLYRQHLNMIEVIRERSHSEGGVVYFDLVGTGVEGYNKFIPYYLHPESTYTVSVLQAPFRTKISVGSNPWVDGPLRHNLASICERYGGGGHPRVGAISLPKNDLEHARKVAGEVAAELRSTGRAD
jgi:hypothetical protein